MYCYTLSNRLLNTVINFFTTITSDPILWSLYHFFPYIKKKKHLNVLLFRQIYNVHLTFLQETLLYKTGRLEWPYYSSIYLVFLITFCQSTCVYFCWFCFAKKCQFSAKRKKCSSLWFNFYFLNTIYIYIYIYTCDGFKLHLV